MQIEYLRSRDLIEGFAGTVTRLAEERRGIGICEVGGGQSPLLQPDLIARQGSRYTVLDISADELGRLPPTYETVQADICDPDLSIGADYDLVFSRMLAEHVADGERFHRNVLRMLKPGGTAIHLFPTLFAVPFIANALMPTWLSTSVLDAFVPNARRRRGKFKAHYSWCIGPRPRQIGRLRALGYEVVEYRAAFGHSYYRRIPLVRMAQARLAEFLLRHPVKLWTTYALVVLRKP